MLFVIKDELAPFCAAHSGLRIEGLQNLLLAVRRGEHAVVAPAHVLEALENNAALGARERSMAKYLLGRRAEIKQLEGLIQRKVFVHAGENMLPRREGDSWHISASELAQGFNARVIVLAENMVDAELYGVAAKHYRIQERVKGVDVSVVCRGGGGSQLDVELAANLEAGFSTVAISDGDKYYPDQGLGDVACRCEELSRSNKGPCWHYSLDCYSAENLIPEVLYLEVCQSEDRHSECERIKLIDQYGSAHGCKASHYFPWKDGITLSEILGFADERKRNFWLSIARKVNLHNKKLNLECIEGEACLSDPCACSLAKGFGRNCLRLVDGWIKDRGIHESKKTFQAADKWLDVGRVVFEVGIAFPPQRI